MTSESPQKGPQITSPGSFSRSPFGGPTVTNRESPFMPFGSSTQRPSVRPSVDGSLGDSPINSTDASRFQSSPKKTESLTVDDPASPQETFPQNLPENTVDFSSTVAFDTETATGSPSKDLPKSLPGSSSGKPSINFPISTSASLSKNLSHKTSGIWDSLATEKPPAKSSIESLGSGNPPESIENLDRSSKDTPEHSQEESFRNFFGGSFANPPRKPFIDGSRPPSLKPPSLNLPPDEAPPGQEPKLSEPTTDLTMTTTTPPSSTGCSSLTTSACSMECFNEGLCISSCSSDYTTCDLTSDSVTTFIPATGVVAGDFVDQNYLGEDNYSEEEASSIYKVILEWVNEELPIELPSKTPTETNSASGTTIRSGNGSPISHTETGNKPHSDTQSSSALSTQEPIDSGNLTCNTSRTDQGYADYWMTLESIEAVRDIFCSQLGSQEYILRPSEEPDGTGEDYSWCYNLDKPVLVRMHSKKQDSCPVIDFSQDGDPEGSEEKCKNALSEIIHKCRFPIDSIYYSPYANLLGVFPY